MTESMQPSSQPQPVSAMSTPFSQHRPLSNISETPMAHPFEGNQAVPAPPPAELEALPQSTMLERSPIFVPPTTMPGSNGSSSDLRGFLSPASTASAFDDSPEPVGIPFDQQASAEGELCGYNLSPLYGSDTKESPPDPQVQIPEVEIRRTTGTHVSPVLSSVVEKSTHRWREPSPLAPPHGSIFSSYTDAVQNASPLYPALSRLPEKNASEGSRSAAPSEIPIPITMPASLGADPRTGDELPMQTLSCPSALYVGRSEAQERGVDMPFIISQTAFHDQATACSFMPHQCFPSTDRKVGVVLQGRTLAPCDEKGDIHSANNESESVIQPLNTQKETPASRIQLDLANLAASLTTEGNAASEEKSEEEWTSLPSNAEPPESTTPFETKTSVSSIAQDTSAYLFSEPHSHVTVKIPHEAHLKDNLTDVPYAPLSPSLRKEALLLEAEVGDEFKTKLTEEEQCEPFRSSFGDAAFGSSVDAPALTSVITPSASCERKAKTRRLLTLRAIDRRKRMWRLRRPETPFDLSLLCSECPVHSPHMFTGVTLASFVKSTKSSHSTLNEGGACTENGHCQSFSCIDPCSNAISSIPYVRTSSPVCTPSDMLVSLPPSPSHAWKAYLQQRHQENKRDATQQEFSPMPPSDAGIIKVCYIILYMAAEDLGRWNS